MPTTLRSVVKIFELEDGNKQYQPCLMRCPDGAALSAGELLFDEFILVDTEEEASNLAAGMLENLLAVLGQVAEGVDDGNS